MSFYFCERNNALYTDARETTFKMHELQLYTNVPPAGSHRVFSTRDLGLASPERVPC